MIGRMLSITVLWFLGAAAASAMRMCHEDGHCNLLEFCHFQSNMCAPCVDCSLYRRQSKAGGSCSKDPQECGNCVEGYISETLSDGSIRALCVPHVIHNEPHPPLAMSSQQGNTVDMGEWMYYSLIVASFVVSGAFIIVLVTKRPLLIKVRSHPFQTSTSDCEVSNLYAPSAPAPPLCLAEASEEISCVRYVSEVAEDRKQQASKYLDPQYVTSPAVPVSHSNEMPLDAVDAGNHEQNDNDFLFDEATLPSNWSPGPDYHEHPMQGLPTSFSGALRLNSSPSSTAESVNHTADSNLSTSVPSTQSSLATVNTG